MRVDQFVPSFVKHDAISNHVIQARRALRSAGFDSEIWYEAADPRVARDGRDFRECDPRPDPERVIVYHASTHSEMVPWLEQAAGAGQRLALDYHNITPSYFFARWEPLAAASMRVARNELERVVPLCGLAMADSDFNRRELVELGHPNTAVCPIILDLQEYHGHPEPRTVTRLRRETGEGSLWLFVGRIAPNKCQHDVVAAFALYRRLFDPHARLAIVGAVTSPRYLRATQSMADDLGVSDAVEFPGAASFSSLLGYFQVADVFVCLSEHEGFCVPVIEAMELGLPVVAYSGSALTETVAGGGVLLEDKDPLAVAVATRELLADAARIQGLVEAGRERAQAFSLDASAATFMDTLREWLVDPH